MKRNGTAVDQPEIEVGDIVHRSTRFWSGVVGICERSLQDAIRRGEVGHVRLGGRVLLSRSHVETWLSAREHKAAA
jgi:excisionase family DNA binding protein